MATHFACSASGAETKASGFPQQLRVEIVCAWNKGHTWNFGKQSEMRNFIETAICIGRERLKNPKHSTQKPVRVLEHLLKLGSKEHDLVFDPFMGVGSSAVAALNMKRRFLGFDNEPTYIKAAGERFKNVCGMKVVPIKRGEAQPFLLTPTPLKFDKAQQLFSIAA
jgi:hypothetical protein